MVEDESSVRHVRSIKGDEWVSDGGSEDEGDSEGEGGSEDQVENGAADCVPPPLTQVNSVQTV